MLPISCSSTYFRVKFSDKTLLKADRGSNIKCISKEYYSRDQDKAKLTNHMVSLIGSIKAIIFELQRELRPVRESNLRSRKTVFCSSTSKSAFYASKIFSLQQLQHSQRKPGHTRYHGQAANAWTGKFTGHRWINLETFFISPVSSSIEIKSMWTALLVFMRAHCFGGKRVFTRDNLLPKIICAIKYPPRT